ncbi:transcription factor asR4-like [Lucilia sericata]|uniref:transcription factor asR4-like n=1 Tax=Lucilia sericata TaxID=13632 RepID=UPI0018A87D60|nr:transcription factor asR4-like [Lucilia sericata]XP_037816439.1 transcription factor asR4-like [Lucilia sericata]XP_037827051.1 transcription factor asR4-like [Lucilia sericata]XP_037827052.1 transcription factor asR4-like [Lucilia sericata]XP_037828513.1 transcription factor asR4-like [Lucilia sericata]XP_037828514.1 transcription factor asR4-like [Lucilia sericata]XP_037828516.1 transcription factor asR4-like [Lucilia sericata]XP_037828517.1 transcription factor asR4-like [Lucilia seric
MSNVNRRLEIHRKPVEAPGSSKDIKTTRDEILRDCRICKKEHALRKCPKFRKMSVGERWETVKKYRYCFNCLAHSHMKDKCTSRERCIECMSEHHTLLHRHQRSKKGAKPEAHQQPTQGSGSPKDRKSSKKRRNKSRGTKNQVGTPQQQHHCCAQHPQQQQYQQQPLQYQQQPQQYQQQPQQYQQQHQQTPATIVINVMSGRIV